MGNKIKVHIADDHKILIDGIVALLKTDKTLKIDGYSLTGEALLECATTVLDLPRSHYHGGIRGVTSCIPQGIENL